MTSFNDNIIMDNLELIETIDRLKAENSRLSELAKMGLELAERILTAPKEPVGDGRYSFSRFSIRDEQLAHTLKAKIEEGK